MKYQYLKLSQIIILSIVAISEENYLIYIGTLLISLLTHPQHWLSSIVSLCLLSLTLISSLEIWKFVLIAIVALLTLVSAKIIDNEHLNIKYVIPGFLLSVSLISINENQIIRVSHLIIFFYFLVLSYYANESKLKVSLYIVNFIWIVEGTYFSIQHFADYEHLEAEQSIISQNKQWWYYLAFPFSIYCSSLVLQSLNQIENAQSEFKVNLIEVGRNPNQQSENVEIQMKHLSKKSSKSQHSDQNKMDDYFKNIQVVTQKQIQAPKKLGQQSQVGNYINKQNKQSSKQNQERLVSQEQSLNLILLIPFLIQSSGIFQIPLYIYLFSIHYNKTNSYLYAIMIITTFVILSFFNHPNQQSIKNDILQRVSIVLLVNKNIQVLNQATQIVRKIWLRSSFVVVLAFLFWFSLKTVNIIHIILTIVLLIFITKKKEKNQNSYRHKNWIYLLTFFNIFLVVREFYHLFIYYNFYTEQQNSMIANIFDFTGISHEYQSGNSFFNMIPLMASSLLAFQYFTYQSRIYDQVRQRPILPIYEQKINQLIQLFTIVYYKLIPWISYGFIFFVLLALEFSCTSLILLVWLLICLTFQIQSKNNLTTYQYLSKLWSLLEKLFAVQIILRYAFQFLNFPLFYNSLQKLYFFGVIDYYKQFLGLAIREADYVYFKTITKFQLMVGLDFICIFISFLVLEYYNYLIIYFELQNETLTNLEQTKFRQKQTVKEIYNQYIDFKLTVYFKKFTVLLKHAAKIFLWIYYPILGIYCCLNHSIVNFAVLLICIRFYLLKNSESYEKFIKQNLILKVKQLFNNWKDDFQSQSLYLTAKAIYEIMVSGKKSIRFDELLAFQRLRKFLLFFSSFGILCNYASRMFQTHQTIDFFENEYYSVLLRIRWLLFISGMSIDSPISLIHLLSILISTILQVKCTRFLHKIYNLSAKRQNNPFKQRPFQEIELKYEFQQDDNKNLHQSLLDEDSVRQRQTNREILQIQELHDADYNIQLERNIQKLRLQNEQGEENAYKRGYSQVSNIRIRVQQNQIVQNQMIQLKVSKKELKKFIEMKVSLLQGITKFVERFFVMVLVFLSIVQNRHPFGIVYLICSIVLTFIGAYSILSLSRTIAILIIAEYLLILANFSNYTLVDSEIDEFKQNFQTANTFDFVSQKISKQWETYFTFGDTTSQILMMLLSWVVLFCYQFYFDVLNKSWQKILDSLAKKISMSKTQKKIYQYSNLIYTYFLIYSPLFITICSLGIYLLDFTITNLFLTFVSIIFLFKSVLVEEYSGSRQFWRVYFYILQFFIVVFILIYDILSIPMNEQYCVKILCSTQEFHTKIYKAWLLFVLQIGIDLTKSTYFISALDNLKQVLSIESLFSKTAIAYKENDKKINKKFKQMNKQKSLEGHLAEVEQFLQKYKTHPDLNYQNKQQIEQGSSGIMDMLLQILPSFVDSTLVLTSQQARQFIQNENQYWIEKRQIHQDQLNKISQMYLDEFGQNMSYEQIMIKINQCKQKHNLILASSNSQAKFLGLRKSHTDSHPRLSRIRKSFSQNRLPYQPAQYCRQRLEQMRQSLITVHQSDLQKKDIQTQEKKKLIFLLILQCIISNWHYLTYFLLIFEHLYNMGILTLPFPILALCYGLMYSYQAPKNVWRINFLVVLLPISFKFCISIGLIEDLSEQSIHLLIGDNHNSILVQYLIILFVLVQCLILKIIGLYDEGVTQVQSMKIALIRNIINNDNQTEISHLSQLLKESLVIPQKTLQIIFGRSQQKAGSSYTTLMTSLQLGSLFFVFFFYDQMAIRKQVTIYQMISYNQFTAGMVILTLIQLGFILVQRFVNISDFKEYSSAWELNLIIKFVFLVINLLYTEFLVLIFFPFNSNNFTENSYINIFYVINAFIFLTSALQIKYGIDQKSKGFMDRYTWYNGFVYMGFRAVPFLFQFKVFSDWTVTKTALRLFDWIKLQQIFGRMYIAKCNSIFLKGKLIGNKIQWWKKLLMGFPLLFAIILLIFGPLILFSNLNPLSSKNSISAGYLQLCLKVNRTNQYVFYTNSHITDIVMLIPNEQQKQILQSYDIQHDTVQVINLEEYSDQYWQISQGSYLKLLDQSLESTYEIVVRMKFERNQTGSTPTYTVNSYELPQNEVINFKSTLQGKSSMNIPNFLNNFLRLDNNNGMHFLAEEKLNIKLYVQQAKKNTSKKYWIIQNGLKIKIASDKYTKAIFGYSVMSFYISIILVIANYFRFLFQGSANTIILNDIPFADPVLSLCNGVYKARYYGNTELQQRLFWLIIDLLRSPDQIKSLTGSYLDARIETKRIQEEKQKNNQHQIEMKEISKNENEKKND